MPTRRSTRSPGRRDRPRPHHDPLVIVGGGAAGLMAACHAAEIGVPAVLLERKHRVGSKLLMCGNGRCNLTTHLPADAVLAAFGGDMATFLQPAITAFPPDALKDWFKRRGLPLMQTRDGKVFPRSERAPDVVHCFSDLLREHGVPLCLNTPVDGIENDGERFTVTAGHLTVRAAQVLVTTGGVSYPKTGSLGDGQRFARAFGHRVTPYRPGLVGVVWQSPWVRQHAGDPFTQAVVTVLAEGVPVAQTRGLVECERWGLGGGAISNATRLIARRSEKAIALEVALGSGRPLRIAPVKTRPLKEAMVTVGGVVLGEVDAGTMESRRTKGLYFAGEVLDIDGPTGGFNLTAAFATARLAVEAIHKTLGNTHRTTRQERPKP